MVDAAAAAVCGDPARADSQARFQPALYALLFSPALLLLIEGRAFGQSGPATVPILIDLSGFGQAFWAAFGGQMTPMCLAFAGVVLLRVAMNWFEGLVRDSEASNRESERRVGRSERAQERGAIPVDVSRRVTERFDEEEFSVGWSEVFGDVSAADAAERRDEIAERRREAFDQLHDVYGLKRGGRRYGGDGRRRRRRRRSGSARLRGSYSDPLSSASGGRVSLPDVLDVEMSLVDVEDVEGRLHRNSEEPLASVDWDGYREEFGDAGGMSEEDWAHAHVLWMGEREDFEERYRGDPDFDASDLALSAEDWEDAREMFYDEQYEIDRRNRRFVDSDDVADAA